MADAKETVRRLLEGVWDDFGVVDEVVADDFVGHDPASPQPIRGPQGAKDNFQTYKDAFAGARITVDEVIAEGDIAAARWTGRGRHENEIMGIAPTGRDVTVSGVSFVRLRDGKIVESWDNWDALGMLVQLGAVPAPAQS